MLAKAGIRIFLFLAAVAAMLFQARLRAVAVGFLLPLAPVVAEGRNGLHALEDLAADRALYAGAIARLRAGGFLGGNVHGVMPRLGDGFGLGCPAVDAGVGPYALRLAGGFLRHAAVVPGMALGGEGHIPRLIAADGAAQALVAVLRAGGRSAVLHIVVAAQASVFHGLGLAAVRAAVGFPVSVLTVRFLGAHKVVVVRAGRALWAGRIIVDDGRLRRERQQRQRQREQQDQDFPCRSHVGSLL